MTPTQEAKQFLIKRLNAEQRMSSLLEEELLLSAEKIVDIAHKYNIPIGRLSSTNDPIVQEEIEKVIQELIEALYEDVEELCIKADKEQRQYIIAFITTSVFGMTLLSRIDKWARDFSVWARLMYDKGYFDKSVRIPMKIGANYGMDRLLRHTIARAWMESKKHNAIDSGARYFSTHRGSSYPCTICDDEQAKGIQPISAFSLPLHNNCCCYAIFYDENKQPL